MRAILSHSNVLVDGPEQYIRFLIETKAARLPKPEVRAEIKEFTIEDPVETTADDVGGSRRTFQRPVRRQK